SIIWTVGIMIFILLVFNVADVAKLASGFQLLLFALLNLAVIVMRESHIEEYDPAFKTPLYPWMPIAGFISSVYLIYGIGFISIFFTLIISAFAVGWYYYYVYEKVDREGAIFHVHERLGRRKDSGLEHEMRGILREKGLRDEDPYEAVAGRAVVFDIDNPALGYQDIVKKASDSFAEKLEMDKKTIYESFSEERHLGAISTGPHTALKHIRVEKDVASEMVLVRIKGGLQAGKEHFEDIEGQDRPDNRKLYAMIFLVSSEDQASQHLRFLAHIVEMADSKQFINQWREAENEAELRHLILRDERFISFTIRTDNAARTMIGKQIKEVDLSENCLITILIREGDIKIPRGSTKLKEGDVLLIVGEVDAINELKEREN